MKVTFLTRRSDHQTDDPLITVLRPEEYNLHRNLLVDGKCKIKSPISYSDWYVISHDIETRGYPESGGELLLSAFCVKDEEVLVIDNTSVKNSEIFDPQTLKYCFFIAHNADYEARWGVAHNFLPGRYGCTMVNGKRLLSGQDGFPNDLVANINRWLGYKRIPIWMDKDIRNQFATCTYFTSEQILYNAADTIRLAELYFRQLEEATTLNQLFLHNSINSRIIIPIAQAEITGIRHNSEQWRKITQERREKAEKLCLDLNQEIASKYQIDISKINPEVKKKEEQLERQKKRSEESIQKLTKALQDLEEKQKTHLKSYKVQKERLEKLQSTTTQELVRTDFGINWTSPKQVLETFSQLGMPMPIAKDKKTRKDKAGVGKEARTNWFVNNTGSPYEPVMKLFDSFKKTEHNIKAFGDNWLLQYVRNERAYTTFDQAGTSTGRFSSGDKGKKDKKRYCNIQQIPVREGKQYRECFIADLDQLLVTGDYRNCEGVIMASLAGDLDAKKIMDLPDSHSYLGTIAWRAAYQKRYERTKSEESKILAETYVMNKSTPEKDKERDTFKNSGGLFPCAYGVTAPKVAATSKIPVDEAQAMIDAVKAQVPKTIARLDENSNQAKTLGYVIHNERTGSRRWFSPVVDHLKYGFPINKSDTVSAEMEARNTGIQGTNADILKEATAYIALYAKLIKQPIIMLLLAHDEWMGSIPQDRPELADKIKELMIRAANIYLIPEIRMDVDVRVATYWKK